MTEELGHEVLLDDETHSRRITGTASVNARRYEFAFRTDVADRALKAYETEGIESPKVPSGVAGELDRPDVD